MSSLLNAIVEIDDAVAALFEATPGVTISSRCGVSLLKNDAVGLQALGKTLDDVQHDHCMLAIIDDLARARAVIAYLEPYEAPARAATKN